MTDDIRLRVGTRIKELRNNLKISQEQLSFKAELDRTYINSVEAGKRNISIIALEKIILALETNYSIFFDDSKFKDFEKV
jgi:transcriptional regulator with XRE-family HTH domain